MFKRFWQRLIGWAATGREQPEELQAKLASGSAAVDTGTPISRASIAGRAVPEGQCVWATNASDHWPEVVAPRELNSLGVRLSSGTAEDCITADAFQIAAFGAAVAQSFEPTGGTWRVSEIKPSHYAQPVDFEFETPDGPVPVLLYPRASAAAARHFSGVTRQLTAVGQPAPVYFAPERLVFESPTAAAPEVAKISLEHKNLLPRIVPGEFKQKFPADAGLLSRQVGSTELLEVLVLDSETQMAFVTGSLLGQLGLSETAAFEVARQNLADRVPANVVNGVLRENLMPMLKSMDGFDAARVLVLPGMLQAGEALAAMIPDRDTLVLMSAPPEKDTPEFWESLANFPGNDGTPPISSRPLRVTCNGIQQM